ncbi:MAG: GTPase Era [Oligoflexia bacterium]|nr:GTPase Era [Oligoflexia bacterium]
MKKNNFRSGFVALIGRPNVGKSSLLNTLLGEKVAAVSPKAQTTRKRLRGIYTDKEAQIVFMDTPGIHVAPEGKNLNEFCVSEALDTMVDVDLFLYLIDGSRPYKPDLENGDEAFILEKIKAMHKRKPAPLFIAVNKVDLWLDKKINFTEQSLFQDTMKKLPVEKIFAISTKTKTGIEDLLKAVKEVMPEGEMLYPEDELTDRPLREITAEIIQEKIFYLTGDEIPYSCAVEIEKFLEPGEKRKFPEIHAIIHVEKNSQKPMLIGRGGKKIKEIGEKSRETIEQLMGTKIVLKLFVKVSEKWTKNPTKLKQLGYALPKEGKT